MQNSAKHLLVEMIDDFGGVNDVRLILRIGDSVQRLADELDVFDVERTVRFQITEALFAQTQGGLQGLGSGVLVGRWGFGA